MRNYSLRFIYIRKKGETMAHQLTKKDIEKMEEEIEYRKLVVRKKLLEDVKEARAQGDLSENFEYYAAKREKNRNESRIRYLDRMVRTAKIIEDHSGEDEVGIGDKITVWFEEEGEEEIFELVTTAGTDSLNNKISIESPIGKAIRGKKLGSRVKVVINPEVAFYIEIRKIEKSAEN